MPVAKWGLFALGVVAALALAAGAAAWIVARSDAVLGARHPLPPSAVRAAATPDAIARGAHLTAVTACATCHGDRLEGHMQTVAGSPVWAPDLARLARRLSDAELDRAIRRGLRPDGRTELAMPSHVYAAFSDAEVAAIIAYLRSLPALGARPAQPSPNLLLRAYLLAGVYQTETSKLARDRPALDAGPDFQAGRHLAVVACGQCHGGDLRGGGGAPGPDLTVRGYYDRRQFHALMRNGDAVGEMRMELMSRTAVKNFSHFDDGEIDAIYDYLSVRDQILSGDAKRRLAR